MKGTARDKEFEKIDLILFKSDKFRTMYFDTFSTLYSKLEIEWAGK